MRFLFFFIKNKWTAREWKSNYVFSKIIHRKLFHKSHQLIIPNLTKKKKKKKVETTIQNIFLK